VANAVDGLSPVHMVRQASVERAVVHVPGPEPLPVGWPFTDRFAVLAGLRAPEGNGLGEFIGLAGRLAAAGADALAITKPGPSAAGVHPIAAGALLGERVRADVLLQVETADRNLPALQADLLGAHALGLHLIVCRTGMPRVAGDYPGIGPPLDVDSVQLVAALSGLNDGIDWRGVSTSDRTGFVIGAAVRTSAKDRGHELARAAEKVAAGAHFLLTEVIYDVPAAHSFLTELRGQDAGVPVVATLAPFEDVTTILRRTHEDPEVAAPAVLPTGGDDVDGVDQVLEAVAALRDLVVGVLVYLPSGSDDHAVSLIERLRGLP
jgi:homocysteine S-methyltransferase